MINKIILIHKKPKKYILINIILIITLITSIILSYKYKTYNSFKVTGISKCLNVCKISTTLRYDQINKIDSNSKIEYKNKIYEINNIEYSEPYLNNNIAYQDIEIETSLKESKIVEIKILYNKQRIIRKIINLILEE